MKKIFAVILMIMLIASNANALTISWTKSWTSADDGTPFSGSDIENIQNDLSTQLASVGTSNSYRTSFVNADLSTGVLTVTHNLTQQYVKVTIYDNSGIEILPDSVTMTSSSIATVDLTSFGTLTGTWRVVVNN